MFRLARKYYQLANKLNFIREKFEEQETDFDFFRYRPQRKQFSNELKSKIRLKFRIALRKFLKKYKAGEADIPKPL